MKNTKLNRRTVLKGIAAIPVATAFGFSTTAAAEAVSLDDPTAKALEYTETSTKEGQSCSNCNLYQGGDAAAGPCPIFGGKDVAAAGWCKSWIAKT